MRFEEKGGSTHQCSVYVAMFLLPCPMPENHCGTLCRDICLFMIFVVSPYSIHLREGPFFVIMGRKRPWPAHLHHSHAGIDAMIVANWITVLPPFENSLPADRAELDTVNPDGVATLSVSNTMLDCIFERQDKRHCAHSPSVYVRKWNVVIFFAIILQNAFKIS